ncbi:5'-nucleotidase C-terminal domain-containing protein [Aestuariibaculum sp. M13]|uniref:5'-nucleotidase C-terminal domain-containing protein n=1 Tax=Aestuariibaculum sp. M13 TaxID=2967132 RepID=UPI002159DFE1|nr:5'-nucleotidase [Aestuariibaculum sp. M13]MCR8669104.1 5'-nucleotidase C-terminal domain-containing protein [Aestuariibaculum sp. M13]
MRFTFLIYLLYISLFISCKQPEYHLTKIEGKQIGITDSLKNVSEIDSFIKPFRSHLNKDLDSVLAYSVGTYSRDDGKFNTAIGNFMADVIYEQSNPVFKSRTGHDIDMVLLSYGSIRTIVSKGDITTRTAFELMPFENNIVIVALKKPEIDKMLEYLCKAKKANPFSKLKLVIDQDYKLIEATIKNHKIEEDKTYYVATQDYLYNGGDSMTFFQLNDSLYKIDYKVRNAIIDYFKKTDTISPTIDDRFIQITP